MGARKKAHHGSQGQRQDCRHPDGDAERTRIAKQSTNDPAMKAGNQNATSDTVSDTM